MNIAINIDSIYEGMSVSWRVAQKSEGMEEHLYRWNGVVSELEGVWNMLNWSPMAGGERSPELAALMMDVIELREIAWHLLYH